MMISLRSARGLDVRFRLGRVAIARDDLHRHFISAAMLQAAQRASNAGDRRIDMRSGAGDNTRDGGVLALSSCSA